jgi:hypothetical protein
MSRSPRGGTVSGVVDGQHDEGFFLVVFDGGASSRDVPAMHRALRQAVTRLGAEGTAIRWCSALLLTDVCRCLCLVEAASRSDVVLARDIAALPTAVVHPVHRLPGDRWPGPAPHLAHPPDSEGRS